VAGALPRAVFGSGEPSPIDTLAASAQGGQEGEGEGDRLLAELEGRGGAELESLSAAADDDMRGAAVSVP
jgi:hypothetical protein